MFGTADNKGITFGGTTASYDWSAGYDESADDRLEFVHTAGAGADVLFDLNDNAADSTFTITNSNGTYEANLSLEGDATIGNITIADAVISSDTGAISFSNENLTTTGTLTTGKHTLNGVLDVYSANADPSAQGDFLPFIFRNILD